MIDQAKDFVARVWVAGLVSAAFGIGGVWFVVDQSLETLRGHVASIDRRMDKFVTKREFDQFLARFTAFESRMTGEFERTRSAYDRASLELGPDKGGRSELAGDFISLPSSAVTIEVGELSDNDTAFLAALLDKWDVMQLESSEPDTLVTLLQEFGYNATAIDAETVRVQPPQRLQLPNN